jgi:hypothetical protein
VASPWGSPKLAEARRIAHATLIREADAFAADVRPILDSLGDMSASEGAKRAQRPYAPRWKMDGAQRPERAGAYVDPSPLPSADGLSLCAALCPFPLYNPVFYLFAATIRPQLPPEIAQI